MRVKGKGTNKTGWLEEVSKSRYKGQNRVEER